MNERATSDWNPSQPVRPPARECPDSEDLVEHACAGNVPRFSCRGASKDAGRPSGETVDYLNVASLCCATHRAAVDFYCQETRSVDFPLSLGADPGRQRRMN